MSAAEAAQAAVIVARLRERKPARRGARRAAEQYQRDAWAVAAAWLLVWGLS